MKLKNIGLVAAFLVAGMLYAKPVHADACSNAWAVADEWYALGDADANAGDWSLAASEYAAGDALVALNCSY